MITSRIMTNRMTSPTAMQVQPRGTSTSNKASAFASDPAVQRALGTVSQPSTTTVNTVPNNTVPNNTVPNKNATTITQPAATSTTQTATPAATTPAAATPAAATPAASSNVAALNPFNQFAGQPYTPPASQAVNPNAGKTTASGAPDIKLAEQPIANAWSYAGPAAKNPYFMTTGSAPDASTVKGYSNWFSNVTVYSGITNDVDHVVNPMNSASPEGAQEALRLVQMYEPGAKLESVRMGEGAGPYLADGPTFSVVLPDGSRLNAGAILNSYYHGGAGVSVESDLALAAEVNASRTLAT